MRVGPAFMVLMGISAATAEDMERVLGVNFKGTFFCFKHAAKQLIKQGKGGRLVGASSIAGKKGMYVRPA